MTSFRIISTLGPASDDGAFVEAAGRLGQPNFRLNGSHLKAGDLEALVGEARERLPGGVRISLDLQGGKRRIGELPAPLSLGQGAVVAFVLGMRAGAGVVPAPVEGLFAGAHEGERLVLQDGAVTARVERVEPQRLSVRIERGGTIRARCGVHVEGRSLASGEIPDAQQDQLRSAARLGVDELALSYVTEAAELERLRAFCVSLGYRPRIIAKLERPEALDAFDAIARAADGLWFCRGDLGSLVPLAELGRLQHEALDAARRLGADLVIAGQVFHHLVDHPEPTRSEVVHLFDIRRAGASGIVLSDETAIGQDPAGALEAIGALLS